MSDQTLIRVMIVDDHKMVRKGLIVLIDGFSDLELVGEAANGAEAIRLCAEVQPDVVLMDLMMPEMNGVDATRNIRQANPAIQIVALTSFKDTELIQAAMQAGVIGYLLKDVSVDELVAAIRAAHAGKPTLAWEAAQALIDDGTSLSSPGHDLTDREREVLAHMTDGLTNRQIAEQLAISRYTINAHVSSILAKLGAASRTEAATLAIQHNLVH